MSNREHAINVASVLKLMRQTTPWSFASAHELLGLQEADLSLGPLLGSLVSAHELLLAVDVDLDALAVDAGTLDVREARQRIAAIQTLTGRALAYIGALTGGPI